MAVVALSTTLAQVESLCELHGLFRVAINDQVTTDKAEDTIVESRLGIKGQQLVLDGRHASELAHNLSWAEELLTFIGQHGRIGVESAKLITVGVKHIVVVLHELFSNLFEVCHVN